MELSQTARNSWKYKYAKSCKCILRTTKVTVNSIKGTVFFGPQCSIINFVYELPHELLNDLRLRMLRNYEISGKSQSWFETEPSAQSRFPK